MKVTIVELSEIDKNVTRKRKGEKKTVCVKMLREWWLCSCECYCAAWNLSERQQSGHK